MTLLIEEETCKFVSKKKNSENKDIIKLDALKRDVNQAAGSNEP